MEADAFLFHPARSPAMGLAVAVLHEEAPPTLAAEADLTLPSIDAVPAFLTWIIN